MTDERRTQLDRRTQAERRQNDDWLYLGPERRRQVADRRQTEADRRNADESFAAAHQAGA